MYLNQLANDQAIYYGPSTNDSINVYSRSISGKCKCQLGKAFHNAYLTSREADCIYYLLRGRTAQGIGEALGLSRRTIESYLENIKGKLGCRSKAQLISAILESDCLSALKKIWKIRNYYGVVGGN